jgi:hypothetical protein
MQVPEPTTKRHILLLHYLKSISLGPTTNQNISSLFKFKGRNIKEDIQIYGVKHKRIAT